MTAKAGMKQDNDLLKNATRGRQSKTVTGTIQTEHKLETVNNSVWDRKRRGDGGDVYVLSAARQTL